jgi:heme-degrading monooxygenase HmoA
VYAVITRVEVSDIETGLKELGEHVVPAASQTPGFVAGYWTRKDDAGESMVVFESEDGAKAWAEKLPSVVPDVVTIEDVDVREVVAHA